MKTENMTVTTNDVGDVSEVMGESKPKRSMEQASQDRITWHMALSAEKVARLATLKPGKAYDRCAASLAKNDAFIAQLRSDLAARLADKASSKAA